eukprot:122138-Rhodomonas_salina.1
MGTCLAALRKACGRGGASAAAARESGRGAAVHAQATRRAGALSGESSGHGKARENDGRALGVGGPGRNWEDEG